MAPSPSKNTVIGAVVLASTTRQKNSASSSLSSFLFARHQGPTSASSASSRATRSATPKPHPSPRAALREHADLHEIDDRDELSRVAEPARDAMHEARLADAARTEHAAQVSGSNGNRQRGVRGALDVAGAIRLDGAANHVELGRVDRFRHEVRL